MEVIQLLSEAYPWLLCSQTFIVVTVIWLASGIVMCNINFLLIEPLVSIFFFKLKIQYISIKNQTTGSVSTWVKPTSNVFYQRLH